jgi:hypothetical protein
MALAALLLAALLAAVLLSACGGGDGDTGSTAAPSAADTVKSHGPTAENQGSPLPPAGEKPKSEPDQTQQTHPKPQPEPAQQPPPASDRNTIPGCPPGLSDQVCRETASAKTRQEKSPPEAGKKQCPSSLSRAECQALVSQPQPEAPKSQSQSGPGECPPALSAEQCAELEARYAEATK